MTTTKTTTIPRELMGTGVELGYNFATGRKSIDTPGPGSVSFGGRRRGRRR